MKKVILKILAILSLLISLFLLIGSLSLFSSLGDSEPSISGGIFFLILSIIFAIPFLLFILNYLKKTKVNREIKRMQNETEKALQQQEIERQRIERDIQLRNNRIANAILHL